MSGNLTALWSELAEPMALTLLHFLWQGALVALVLAVTLQALRHRAADLRYRCACWALLAMVVLPTVTLLLLIQNETPLPATMGPGTVPVGDTVTPAALPVTTSGTAAQMEPAAGSWRLPPLPYKEWICAVWLGGVLLLSVLHLGGWLQVQRLRRHLARPVGPQWQDMARRLSEQLGLARPVQVLSSAAVRIPTAIGWLKPVVLVPAGTLAGLTPTQVECLLAHELAHIWRRDYLVNLLQVLAETLLFYHPAMWWVTGQIRAERENACDDIAVELTGNRLAYARTLVDLEELRLASPRLAMGADGGSLVRRIGRIVGGQNMNASPRKPLLAAILAVTIILGVSVIGVAAPTWQAPDTDEPARAADAESATDAETSDRAVEAFDADVVAEVVAVTETGRSSNRTRDRADSRTSERESSTRSSSSREEDALEGRWTMDHERGDRDLQLRLKTRNTAGDMGTTLRRADFTGLNFTEDDDFTLSREAGTFTFTGGFESDGDFHDGSGRFTFVPDERYRRDLEDLGVGDLSYQKHMVLALQDLRIETVEGLYELGYRRIDADNLIPVAIFDVTPAYVREMKDAGFDDLSLNKLIAMRVHDIDSAYAEEMADGGFKADSADDLIAWRVHGLDEDYAREIEDAGFGHVSGDKLLACSVHGIDGDYLRELKEAGLPTDDLNNVLAFKIHGVDADFLRQAHKNFGHVDAEDLLAMRIHGVDDRFIRDMAELGYEDIDVEDLISCKIHGVTPRYIRTLEDKGLRRFSLDELVRLRISGVEL